MIALNRVDLMAFLSIFQWLQLYCITELNAFQGGGGGGGGGDVLCIVWPQIYQEW